MDALSIFFSLALYKLLALSYIRRDGGWWGVGVIRCGFGNRPQGSVIYSQWVDDFIEVWLLTIHLNE